MEGTVSQQARSEIRPYPQIREPDTPNRMMQALNANPFSPLFSPFLHENLSELPAAFFQLCGLDPLEDEGVLYEKVLR